uniref:Uncharacterized protein n=1 Tax=Physcomitrium patens TaxID=3218 RepID=A0A2K1KUN3_PHYPA|nr:hypothetical protein PHYPA_004483 [Physcomitrium patens]
MNVKKLACATSLWNPLRNNECGWTRCASPLRGIRRHTCCVRILVFKLIHFPTHPIRTFSQLQGEPISIESNSTVTFVY